MQVSVERINGKLCTVVWHEISDLWSSEPATLSDGSIAYFHRDGTHLATALPALPRNPKPEDAALLYRYMSEGITLHVRRADGSQVIGILLGIRVLPSGKFLMLLGDGLLVGMYRCHIDHVTMNGERCEIAITDKGD